jgi:transcriptional regulator with XRE-family HTH domain
MAQTWKEKQALGAALRRARVLHAMGLRELARQSDVSATYLSKVETGQQKPSERILRIYSDMFCVDFDELNRLAGRVPGDVRQHLVQTPGAIKRLRNQMEKGKGNGKGKKRRKR